MEAYFDNSATTRCSDGVASLMQHIFTEDYGNPASLHRKGVEAERYVREARTRICKTLKAGERELIFTSGGTESDNLAIIGGALANQRAGHHLITTKIEHPAVANAMRHLEELGFEVTWLDVDARGLISLDELGEAVRGDTVLVSIMYVNNEIGSVLPIAEAARRIREKNPNTLFHVDAVQAYGKLPIQPKKLGVDLLSASGHKIHGPKGVGFLYVKEKTKLQPILFGGGHQWGLRSGTENVPGIAGLGLSCEEAYEDFAAKQEYLYGLRSAFIERLRALPYAHVNGDARCFPEETTAAPHIVSVSFDSVRSEVLLHALEDKGIYVSAGSACSSNKPAASATLQAIGIKEEYLDTTLRFSFSVYNTMEEIDYCAGVLQELVPMLARYTRS